MLYIVASMDEELDGLRRELAARPRHSPGGAGFPVECRRLGVGPRRAGDAMAEALSGARRPSSAALMLGVAGAVEPGLETGRLLLADSYVLDSVGESPESIAPSAEMLAAAVAAAADVGMAAHRGASLTVDHLVCDGAERGRLRECYGVASVNMEDYAVAAAAHRAGVPFLSVRVVLDTAEQRLPGYLPGLSKGRGAVVTQVMAQPWRIPTLLRLRSQMELCQGALARFAMAYLNREGERRKTVREKASREAIY